MSVFEAADGNVANKTNPDGAYFEQHGERPKPTSASERYTAAYWKARKSGKTIPEAIEIGKAAMVA